MSAPATAPAARPKSDVSAAVGLVGLAGLLAWVAFARAFPAIAETFDWAVPRDTLGGRSSALVGLLAAALPMAAWSIFVEKV
ncbi:MAG TPA: protein-S-isoprenylcysteine methyltransferase, partial [Erythrobacter sp.]|nr:protein-S-isoprenylcysteine methyltransferase [Erythrobacter sp.]